MAGAAEAPAGLVSGALAAPLGRLRARLLARSPGAIALTLAGVAVMAHLLLWDTEAPWGRAGPAGALLALGGIVWVLWARSLLRAAGTPVRHGAQPLVLVDEGPYRFGRHPMVIGLAAVLLGAALASGMPLLALAAVVFVAIVATLHAPHEEAQLLRRFGGWYRDYAGAVRRWL
jgi:protein-S-isoprenylcysteine O-methyltransferase Ste14